MRRAILILLATVFSLRCFAQTAPIVPMPPTDESTLAEPSHATESRPVLDQDSFWGPIVLILIGMMFLSAAVIGPIVRLNLPEEVPPAHSHDEPPGASHHHGASGTLNPAPEADLGEHHH